MVIYLFCTFFNVNITYFICVILYLGQYQSRTACEPLFV